jgi:hypothetical protein
MVVQARSYYVDCSPVVASGRNVFARMRCCWIISSDQYAITLTLSPASSMEFVYTKRILLPLLIQQNFLGIALLSETLWLLESCLDAGFRLHPTSYFSYRGLSPIIPQNRLPMCYPFA